LLAPLASAPGQTLEFTASFTASPKQAVGSHVEHARRRRWRCSSIGADRELYARTVNGSRLPRHRRWRASTGAGKPHRYQIVWSGGDVSYYIDGTLMILARQHGYGTTTMRPVISTTGGRRRRASASTGSG
jgi:hypothetical protein